MNTELPEMSGVQATRALRTDTRFKALPLIGCLSKDAKDAPEALLQKGFSSILVKPLLCRELETELRRFLPDAFVASPHEVALQETQSCQSVPTRLDSFAHGTPPVPPASPELPVPSVPVPPAPLPTLDLTEALARLSGFDCAKGLRRVMGNFELYKKLLVHFKQELETYPATMQAAREESLEAVRGAVHKLKGVSGNLGAERLYAQTIELEALLKAQGLEASQQELDILMVSVQETWNSLDGLPLLPLQQPPQVLPCVPPRPATTPVSKEMLAAFDETRSLLRQCTTAARESFDRLSSFFDASRAQELKAIKESIDSFDFAFAEEQLTIFARTLGLNAEVPQ
ncbi:MAG: Hpt domain-containing protein, partial [Bilophila sp.]